MYIVNIISAIKKITVNELETSPLKTIIDELYLLMKEIMIQ